MMFNASLPFACIALLFSTFATVDASNGIVEVIERYGFPTLVSVVLWLRLERNQKDDRADRLASDREWLTAISALTAKVDAGQQAHLKLALDAVRATDRNASALESVADKLKSRVCMANQVQMELFDRHTFKGQQLQQEEADYGQ